MQMMNYHKVSEQDRIKFELSMLFTVIEESYNIGFSSEFWKPEYVIVISRTILHAKFFQPVEAF